MTERKTAAEVLSSVYAAMSTSVPNQEKATAAIEAFATQERAAERERIASAMNLIGMHNFAHAIRALETSPPGPVKASDGSEPNDGPGRGASTCARSMAVRACRERDDARAEVERLRAHIDVAGDGANLAGLLDLYDERRCTAEVERDEARAEVERVRARNTRQADMLLELKAIARDLAAALRAAYAAEPRWWAAARAALARYREATK